VLSTQLNAAGAAAVAAATAAAATAATTATATATALPRAPAPLLPTSVTNSVKSSRLLLADLCIEPKTRERGIFGRMPGLVLRLASVDEARLLRTTAPTRPWSMVLEPPDTLRAGDRAGGRARAAGLGGSRAPCVALSGGAKEVKATPPGGSTSSGSFESTQPIPAGAADAASAITQRTIFQ
jgi:hypothetical protein